MMKTSSPHRVFAGNTTFKVFTLVSVFAVLTYLSGSIIGFSKTPVDNLQDYPQCPNVERYRPQSYSNETFQETLKKIISDESFRNQSASKMTGAVQHDTSSYDSFPLDVSGNLELFQNIAKFQVYLQDTFPHFHEELTLEKVNHFGLIYTWEGTDTSLKPLLLMAHQDVVPINKDSLSQWVHDPFSGDYDGKYLYGRGSGDCKNLLIGHMEAVEELIKIGFKPTRTVIFSYGFDEEISGLRNHNGKYLEEKLGPKSLYAVMDEGGVSMVDIDETTLAVVGTGEKGYLDVSISIQKKGGHSSLPQEHTAIGIMGSLIVQVENDHFPTYFTDHNPTFYQYVCLAEHAVDIDETLRKNILESQFDEDANAAVREFIDKSILTGYAIKTTQALDVINGGVKVNALPEYVELIINSRVSVDESVPTVFDKFVRDAEIIAHRYNLGLSVQYPYSNNSEEIVILPPTDVGVLYIKPDTVLEPSPVTPVNDKHWEVFAGTIRHVYEEIAYPDEYSKEDMVVVTPGLGTGNTDTKLYWNLTDHIYRYRPGVLPSVNANSHGINEYIEFDSHLQIIAFIFEYIQSVDQVDD
jgi:Gly-Xaa carboxypeptidase